MRALCAGLPAGRVAFDHRGPQPLRRAVHRSGQTGRTGTDDHEVVQRPTRRWCAVPSASARSRGPAPCSDRAVGQQHQRELVIAAAEQSLQPRRLGIALQLEPLVVHVVAGQEHLRVVAALRPTVADDADAVEPVAVLATPSRRAGRRGPGTVAPPAAPTASSGSGRARCR